jgi:hypothetical protein
MSSEEAWIRINNALAHTAELLANVSVHQAQADERQAQADERQAQADERQARADERQARADKEMAELRQLSKASDERLDRHIEFVAGAIAKTAAAQEVTEEQLQRLINKVDTVDDRVNKLEKKKP